jgi:hypothetical protein
VTSLGGCAAHGGDGEASYATGFAGPGVYDTYPDGAYFPWAGGAFGPGWIDGGDRHRGYQHGDDQHGGSWHDAGLHHDGGWHGGGAHLNAPGHAGISHVAGHGGGFGGHVGGFGGHGGGGRA